MKKRTERRTFSYYSFEKIDSFNASYNLVAGGRGIGKTYGCKKKVIKNFIRRGEMFIYLRRYKSELVDAKNTFFADVAKEFPEWEFRVNGNQAEIAPADTADMKKRPWQVIGYFVALSTAAFKKSVSYDVVTTIIFDEFIIERGAVTYLPNEEKIFKDFYSTVDRYQDKTRVFFLANAVSISNPYFLAWRIFPDEEGEFVFRSPRRSGGYFVVAQFPDSAEFESQVYETDFGQFIAGTEYAEFAISNTFADNNDEMVGEKPSSAKYQFTLETRVSKFSVWYSPRTQLYYALSKLPKSEIVFVLDAAKMGEGKALIGFSDRPLANLRTAFRTGRIKFDHPATRNSFAEIFKR